MLAVSPYCRRRPNTGAHHSDGATRCWQSGGSDLGCRVLSFVFGPAVQHGDSRICAGNTVSTDMRRRIGRSATYMGEEEKHPLLRGASGSCLAAVGFCSSHLATVAPAVPRELRIGLGYPSFLSYQKSTLSLEAAISL